MIGQGSPNERFARLLARHWPVCGDGCSSPHAGRPAAVRGPRPTTYTSCICALRLDGVEPPRCWQGMIQVNTGTLESPRALGVDADEPGSIWAESGQVFIRSPSRRSYDGLDVTVHVPVAVKLTVQLTSADQRCRYEPHDSAGRRARRVSKLCVGQPGQPPAGAFEPPATSWSCAWAQRPGSAPGACA